MAQVLNEEDDGIDRIINDETNDNDDDDDDDSTYDSDDDRAFIDVSVTDIPDDAFTV